jgi:hypothetical protein
MWLSEAQSCEPLPEHGTYVTGACDRCGAVVGPIRWTIRGTPLAKCPFLPLGFDLAAG